jgi:hypothetical protein
VSVLRDHLLSRGLNPDQYSVILDEDKCIATFLIWDLSGRLVGYQRYNPKGIKHVRNDKTFSDHLKYFTYAGVEGDEFHASKKKLIAWGFESFKVGQRVLFITEGIFDAVKLHNVRLPALAVISNDPKHLQSLFKALGRTIIAVCDRDNAGSKLANYADVALYVPKPYHDLGDMPQEEVSSWLTTVYKIIN